MPRTISTTSSPESYFDLAANWAITEKTAVTLGINNVLDDNPQLSGASAPPATATPTRRPTTPSVVTYSWGDGGLLKRTVRQKFRSKLRRRSFGTAAFFSAHGAAANPLRQEPLGAACGRQACVHGSAIRLRLPRLHLRIKGIAAPTAVSKANKRERRLAALVIVVEVHEECQDALSMVLDLARQHRGRWLLEVRMQAELLSRLVVQQFRNFEVS